jgi:excinuclease UvrABC ATPase subunit
MNLTDTELSSIVSDMKTVYKFRFDCHRNGELHGLFIADSEDVRKLIEILQRLVDKGNTVMVIEHNLDLIKNADYIIDIGPEGGVGGGEIVAKGTPEEVSGNSKSFTAKYLRKLLRR